jgi:hypothetical protein
MTDSTARFGHAPTGGFYFFGGSDRGGEGPDLRGFENLGGLGAQTKYSIWVDHRFTRARAKLGPRNGRSGLWR